MFTVCPKCDLTLAITARDLRAAQGHVRCGRCHNVFNALDSLSEEPPQAPPGASAAQPPEPPAEIATGMTAEIAAGEELSAEFEPGPPAPAERPQALPALEREVAVEAPAADSGFEADAPHAPPEPQSAAPPAQTTDTDFALEPDRPRASVGWTLGAVLLAALLALQIANHYRDTLATFPSIAGPLRAVYGALGVGLTPRWDVRAYDARQLGATVSGTNPREITVRASIANRAPWAQPLPLLRVTLQDRFGRPIAARDVQPRDYLPSVPASPLLPPGARIDASVIFISPGSRTVGFEIDACLPEDGTVICAHGS